MIGRDVLDDFTRVEQCKILGGVLTVIGPGWRVQYVI